MNCASGRASFRVTMCQFAKYVKMHFYVLLTGHLGIIFVNNQLDANYFSGVFISILYMFRAAMCLSSEELIVSIRHLVYVTLYR